MMTILLVDDDAAVRAMAREALEVMGYRVLDAGDGEEALHIEELCTDRIDLLLTDIVMPGLSGPDLAREFTPRRPRAKVLYMSAFTLVDISHHTISVDPGAPLLTKPFTLDALERKVREVLTPSPFARPSRATGSGARETQGTATTEGKPLASPDPIRTSGDG